MQYPRYLVAEHDPGLYRWCANPWGVAGGSGDDIENNEYQWGRGNNSTSLFTTIWSQEPDMTCIHLVFADAAVISEVSVEVLGMTQRAIDTFETVGRALHF